MVGVAAVWRRCGGGRGCAVVVVCCSDGGGSVVLVTVWWWWQRWWCGVGSGGGCGGGGGGGGCGDGGGCGGEMAKGETVVVGVASLNRCTQTETCIMQHEAAAAELSCEPNRMARTVLPSRWMPEREHHCSLLKYPVLRGQLRRAAAVTWCLLEST